jgi:hypothetical protein
LEQKKDEGADDEVGEVADEVGQAVDVEVEAIPQIISAADPPKIETVSEYHIRVKYKNGVVGEYWRFPILRSLTWANFRKRWSTGLFRDIFNYTMGGETPAVSYTTRLMNLINSAQFDEGVTQATGTITKLSPEGTVSFQAACGLTESNFRKVKSTLLAYNMPIFATTTAIKKVKNQFNNAIIPGTTLLWINEEGTPNNEQVKLNWHYTEPYGVFDTHMKKLQATTTGDNYAIPTIGRKYGPDDDEAVFITVSGDHGGEEFKMICVIAARDEDGQKYVYGLGQLNYKDTYQMLSNCFMEKLNEGLKKLMGVTVVVCDHSTGFEFALIDSGVLLSEDVVPTFELDHLVGLKNGEVELFPGLHEKKINRGEYKVRCLPIKIVMTGDLAFIALIQGREGYSPHHCMFCDKKKKEWLEKPVCGCIWTPELIDQQYARNQSNPDLPNEMPEIDEDDEMPDNADTTQTPSDDADTNQALPDDENDDYDVIRYSANSLY